MCVAVCEYLFQLVINTTWNNGIQWAIIVPERSKIKGEVINTKKNDEGTLSDYTVHDSI